MAVDDSVATQWSVAAQEIISHPGGANWVGEALGWDVESWRHGRAARLSALLLFFATCSVVPSNQETNSPEMAHENNTYALITPSRSELGTTKTKWFRGDNLIRQALEK